MLEASVNHPPFIDNHMMCVGHEVRMRDRVWLIDASCDAGMRTSSELINPRWISFVKDSFLSTTILTGKKTALS